MPRFWDWATYIFDNISDNSNELFIMQGLKLPFPPFPGTVRWAERTGEKQTRTL